MNRNYLVEMSLISGLIGLVSEYFSSLEVTLSILLVLIVFDTITGISWAVKRKRFACKGLRKLVKKLATYSLAISTVRLLEVGIVPLVQTTALSHIMTSFLVITEAISVLEKLALLGVPISSGFIGFLVGNIKLPGMDKPVKLNRDSAKYISDIDDIIAYQIPTFDDPCLKKLLEVKFTVWRDIAIQLDNALRGDDAKSPDLIYYKVLSLIEAGFDTMHDRWKEEEVSGSCIERFMKMHQPKIDEWLVKVKTTCLSDDGIEQKREKLIDSIVIILYQTVIDARKGTQSKKGGQDVPI